MAGGWILRRWKAEGGEPGRRATADARGHVDVDQQRRRHVERRRRRAYAEGRSASSRCGFRGPSTSVTTLDAAAQETGHQWPQFLPGGRRFLYGVRSANPTGTDLRRVPRLDGEDPRAGVAGIARHLRRRIPGVCAGCALARGVRSEDLKVGATQQIIASDIAAAGLRLQTRAADVSAGQRPGPRGLVRPLGGESAASKRPPRSTPCALAR